MKNKTICLTLPLLVFFQIAFSQVKLSIIAELGLNSSGIPLISKYKKTNTIGDVKETNTPIISPKIGVHTKMEIGNHLYSSLGVQYLKVGNRYHYHATGLDNVRNETYMFDEWENQIFHKIVIPMALGYNFKIKNRELNFGIGYGETYYVNGIHNTKTLFVQKSRPSTIDANIISNPFNSLDYPETAFRRNGALFLELGMCVANNIILEFAYTFNQPLSYGFISGWEGFYKYYRKSDISIVAKYNLR